MTHMFISNICLHVELKINSQLSFDQMSFHISDMVRLFRVGRTGVPDKEATGEHEESNT